MSLRRKLLAMKADWEKWENRISIAVAVFFAGAVIANAGLFFSVRKTPSFFGAAFSWLYAVSWFPAAMLLRNRARWVRAAVILRWTAVAAILLGGASVNKASIANVIIGTLLFQGLVTMTPTVITALIHTDVSEVIRIIVSNGMVIYALTRKTEGAK